MVPTDVIGHKAARERASGPQTGRSRLLDWNEIEPWQQENRFIHGSYRPASYSYNESLLSLTYIHNETVNIYSHLLGALFFVAVAVSGLLAYAAHKYGADSIDMFGIGVFLLAAVICLGSSTVAHALCDHSQEVAERWSSADFMGILVLITGSFYPGVLYGFYCSRRTVYMYWSLARDADACFLVWMHWLTKLSRSQCLAAFVPFFARTRL